MNEASALDRGPWVLGLRRAVRSQKQISYLGIDQGHLELSGDSLGAHGPNGGVGWDSGESSGML
jgi:hypothetical protein